MLVLPPLPRAAIKVRSNFEIVKSVKIIRDYLRISCPIEKAPKILNSFFKKNNLNIFISDDYFPIKKIILRMLKLFLIQI